MVQVAGELAAALQHAMELSPDGMLLLDGQRCLYANASAGLLLGHCHRDLLGQEFALTLPSHEQQAIRENLLSDSPGGWSSLLPLSDGGERAVEFRPQVLPSEGKPLVALSLRDMTAARLLTRKTAAVAQIAASMTYAGTLEGTLDALARSVVQITGVQACTVVLADEEQQPHMAGIYGLPEGLTARLQAIWQAGVGAKPPSLRAAELGETLVIRHVPQLFLSDLTYASVHGYMRTAPWDTMLAVPLLYRGRALGSLAAHYPKGVEPGEEEIAFLTTIADQAAVAVENARLAAKAQEQAAFEERQRAGHALRASEIRLRTIIEQSPYGIQIFAPDGTPVYVNRAWEKLRGVTLEQIRGYNILKDRQLEAKGLMPYIEKGFAGEATALPSVMYVPDETIAGVTDVPHWWVRSFIYPIKDDRGTVREVVLVHEDITEQKEAEEELRRTEQQYRSIFEATGDGLIIIDMEGCIVEANPAACDIYGYDHQELLTLHPQVLPARIIERILATGSFQGRAVNRRKDGAPIHIEGHITTFTYQGEPHVLAVVRDITERVQAEEQLRETYELLEQRVEERTRELSTLLDVSHNVASTLELQPLLGLILDQLRVVTEYSGASVLLLEGENLVVLARRGPQPDSEGGPARYPLETVRPILDVLRPGKPVIIDDVRGDSPLARAYRVSVGGYLDTTFSYERAVMNIPMMVKDRLVGALSVSSTEPGAYTEDDARLVMAIANQAAVAIENARLYEQAQELAAVHERQRLARELHDSVTQALFSMTLQARASRLLLDREGANPHGPLARSVRELSNLAQGALAEMRALIFELRPGALQEEGLVAAVRKHTAALSARQELSIEVRTPADQIPLAPAAEEHLYRLIQEALHNVVKHAGASRVEVRIELEEDGRLMVEVVDDGVGFDPALERPGHMGLTTMAERAERIGGRLEITSAPGKGTTVRAVVPGSVGCAPLL